MKKKIYFYFILLIIGLTMTGCGRQMFKSEVESEVLTAMGRLKTGDLDKALKSFNLDESDEDYIRKNYGSLDKKIIKSYFEKTNYMVKENIHTSQGPSVKLYIEYASPQELNSLLDLYRNKMIDQDQLLRSIKKMDQYEEKEIDIELNKVNKRWLLDNSLVLSFIDQLD